MYEIADKKNNKRWDDWSHIINLQINKKRRKDKKYKLFDHKPKP